MKKKVTVEYCVWVACGHADCEGGTRGEMVLLQVECEEVTDGWMILKVSLPEGLDSDKAALWGEVVRMCGLKEGRKCSDFDELEFICEDEADDDED